MTKKQKRKMKKLLRVQKLSAEKAQQILESINQVSQVVMTNTPATVTDLPDSEQIPNPYNLIRASSLKVFDEEGRHISESKLIVNEERHEQRFVIVSKDYKIAQHNEVVYIIEESIRELRLETESNIIRMNRGGRIRMEVIFPTINIRLTNGEVFTMCGAWDNSYDCTTGLRLIIGAYDKPNNKRLFIENRYAAFYHRHTKGLDICEMTQTVKKSAEVFQNKVEADFNRMLSCSITLEKALNFIDSAIEHKLIADIYLKTIRERLSSMRPEDMGSQWYLYKLVNEIISQRVESLDTKERYLKTLNSAVKKLK